MCGCAENIATYPSNLVPQALELPVTVMCAHSLIAGVPFGITAAYKPMPTPIGEVNAEHLYKFMADIVSQVKADLKKIGAWDSSCFVRFCAYLVYMQSSLLQFADGCLVVTAVRCSGSFNRRVVCLASQSLSARGS